MRLKRFLFGALLVGTTATFVLPARAQFICKANYSFAMIQRQIYQSEPLYTTNVIHKARLTNFQAEDYNCKPLAQVPGVATCSKEISTSSQVNEVAIYRPAEFFSEPVEHPVIDNLQANERREIIEFRDFDTSVFVARGNGQNFSLTVNVKIPDQRHPGAFYIVSYNVPMTCNPSWEQTRLPPKLIFIY